jgi:mono/diheme cytochrome c family protein
MKKIMKWIGIVLGGLIGLLVRLVAVLYLIGGSKQHKTWKIEPEALVIPSDAGSLARGDHLVHSVAICVGCHGDNLAGKVLINQPIFAVIYALNLTPGQGGAGAEFKDLDFVRAIRHGVDPDGRALIVMPAQNFYYMNDADLGAVIAYLRTLSPVDNKLPDPQLGLLARILIATGMIKAGDIFTAEQINHAARPVLPEAGVTREYGDYLVHIGGCHDCHGENFAGGADPNVPLGANLTPGGDLGKWDEATFMGVIRAGNTPSGRRLSKEMPWVRYSGMTDDELKAVWLSLASLPALPNNPAPAPTPTPTP